MKSNFTLKTKWEQTKQQFTKPTDLSYMLNNNDLANIMILYVSLNMIYNGEEFYFSSVATDNITQYFLNWLYNFLFKDNGHILIK